MARWGEGDPRWIVEEREDCKNVNNWHWTEKNATLWSQKRIKDLLKALKIEDSSFSCEILEVSKCEGDAVANNRKGKLIFFYEWIIECKWQGKCKETDNETVFCGKAEVLNLSDENTADELDILIFTDSSSDSALAVKRFMLSRGVEDIREALAQYIKELKEEYSKDLILPSKNQAQQRNEQSSFISSQPTRKSLEASSSQVSSTPLVNEKTIEIKEDFFCTPEDLYRVLTNNELVTAFTRSNAIVEAREGGKFSLWSGNVNGIFTKLVTDKLIRMDWRRSNWPSDLITKVEIELSASDRGTSLKLTQTGLLESDSESTCQGWHINYFQAIKQTFGYGSILS